MSRQPRWDVLGLLTQELGFKSRRVVFVHVIESTKMVICQTRVMGENTQEGDGSAGIMCSSLVRLAGHLSLARGDSGRCVCVVSTRDVLRLIFTRPAVILLWHIGLIVRR